MQRFGENEPNFLFSSRPRREQWRERRRCASYFSRFAREDLEGSRGDTRGRTEGQPYTDRRLHTKWEYRRSQSLDRTSLQCMGFRRYTDIGRPVSLVD